MSRPEEQSAADYCKVVCKKYKLNYTDKVRQHFSPRPDIKKNDKCLVDVIEIILPKIPKDAQTHINSYIDQKVNLYS